jgi:ubiquinone/menaquinone biosynthesis C-methylase UbiE
MQDARDWEIWTFDKVKALEDWWKPGRDNDFVRSILPNDHRSVLDVGCGIGRFYDILTENGASYLGIDSSDAMIERAKERLGMAMFEKGDIYDIGFPDESFDLVFCWGVLFHLPNIEAPVKELCRVSKKYVIFNIWSSTEKNTLTRGAWNEYIAEYTEEFVRGLLREQSFNAQVTPYIYRLDDGEVENYEGHRLSRKVFKLRRKSPCEAARDRATHALVLTQKAMLTEIPRRDQRIRELELEIAVLNNSLALRLARKLPFGSSIRKLLSFLGI